ncbi:MAG: TRAP transporter small permease subunit [Alphaproteobacteria bacterium]|nr:TRAP transporter small permease subunit [Alphaproteobacteria bacterium]
MRFLVLTIKSIDTLNEYMGRFISWLTLGTVLTCFLVVILRYIFSMGFVWMQELYVWQHAVVFMIGAGYTFLHNDHVRVDIFYSPMSQKSRAWTDLFGTLFFLFPWLGVIFWFGWSFISLSWQLKESSSQAGGLQGFFLLKLVIFIFCILVGLQGISLFLKSLLIILGFEKYIIKAEEAKPIA